MPRKHGPKGKRGGGAATASPRWNPKESRLNAFATAYDPASPFARSGPGARGHTMADEARNTGKRPRFGGQDAKLRHKPVKFISAGLMNPMKELEKEIVKELEVEQSQTRPSEQVMEQVEQHVVPEAPEDDTTTDSFVPGMNDNLHASCEEEATSPSPPALFVVDTTGDSSLRPKKLYSLPVLPRDESAHESDSSEEVILFRGRDPALRSIAQSAAQSRRPSPKLKEADPPTELREIDVQIEAVERIMEQTSIANRTDAGESTIQKTEQVSLQGTITAEVILPVAPESSRLDALLDPTESEEERALIADYLAHMDDDDDDDEDNEEGDETDAHPGLGSHAFHILRDLGGSDSDAVPDPVTDDDSDENASGEENAADSDVQRRLMELEDARMARMLAKQEELGFGSGDVMLFDGTLDEDEDGNWLIAPKATPRRKKKGSKPPKIVQKKGQYPSATAMADAFDDIDLMDWKRAATSNVEQVAQRFSKHNPPEHDDPDLQEAMQLTWKKDRLKKAERKKQREALRAQGLLGKNVNPDDLRVKYLVGMSKDELVEELEQFLLGDDEQLIFPPLDKHARKCLHTVASHLKIKSQSSGNGDNRHPVLYRTGRTLAYEERTFESIVNRVIRRPYFTRVDVDTETAKAARSGPSASRKGASSLKRHDNAISYKEGEIVGQHAAELTSDNKGRMLLEKMGWSKGMALGTIDNKGIMMPITHVMKKTKLGLGEL